MDPQKNKSLGWWFGGGLSTFFCIINHQKAYALSHFHLLLELKIKLI